MLNHSEAETNDVLGEVDDVTLVSVASSYMWRNLSWVRDYDTSLFLIPFQVNLELLNDEASSSLARSCSHFT